MIDQIPFVQRTSQLCPRQGYSTALSARYDGWVRSGKDGKGLVKSRPRKQIANAVTTMVGRGIADPRDGLGNTTPHIVYKFE